MRKNKKVEKSKNLHLGFYFGVFVAFIILISLLFKVFETIKRSEFDNNFFTIAVISEKKSEIISVSPKDGELKILRINGANKEKTLRSLGVPYDSLSQKKNDESLDPKTYFSKLLFHQNGISSNLTIVDQIRLFINAQKADGAKISESSISPEDVISPEWFHDPAILREEFNIEITNTTGTQGLGNKFAKVISNMGGNVVLVNSSQNNLKKSIIYSNNESYTVNKLSKLLNIPVEKRETSAISDIIINIGEDRADF